MNFDDYTVNSYDDYVTGLEPRESCECPYCRTQGLAELREQCRYY